VAARDGGSGVGTSGVGHAGDGGAGVDGIGSACGAGGVCDCGGGVAGCFARGVCGGVAGGPSRFSSAISAMVVESKPDVELPTAPFWFRYVNFEPLLVWRQPLQPPTVHGPRPLALEARLSCSYVLRGGLRPSPKPSATYGPRLPRAAGSGSSASQAGGCGVDGGTRWPQQRRRKRRRWRWRRRRRRHRQRMRRWRRMRRRQRRLLYTRRMRRRHWRPKPLFLYHQRDGR